MPTLTVTYQTEQERRTIEAAVAFATEMHALAQAAPTGQVLSACEERALSQGRELLRSTLAHAVQDRIQRAEEKGAQRGAAAPAPAPSASSAATVSAT